MANLTEFLSQVNQQGLARSNRWIVRVYPPRGLTATGNAISNILNKGGNKLSINLPVLDSVDRLSRTLEDLKLDLGPVSVGHSKNVPTLGYVLSGMKKDMQQLTLFANACQLPGRQINSVAHEIFGERREIGYGHVHETMSIQYYCSEDLREKLFFEQWQDLIFNPNSKQRGYYDDYTSEIEVIKCNANWKPEATYKFYEAYPMGMSALELTSGEGDLNQININFSYRYYEKVE